MAKMMHLCRLTKHISFHCHFVANLEKKKSRKPKLSACYLDHVALLLHSSDNRKLLKSVAFEFVAFSNNFCPIKSDLSGNTIWPQALGFQKLAKIFGIFNDILSTQNVDVARFARNIFWQFLVIESMYPDGNEEFN